MTKLTNRAYYLIELLTHTCSELESLLTDPKDLELVKTHYKAAIEASNFEPDIKTYKAIIALVKTFP